MKIKRICILMLLLLLSGCRLAVEEERVSMGRDRLIGVFITPEHLDLFDAERYFEDNIRDVMNGGELSGDTSAYQNRLYLEWVDGELSAGEVKGWFYCAPRRMDPEGETIAVVASDAIADGRAAIYEGDDERLELECTLYVSSHADFVAAYVNPVYQDAERNIYVVSGSGISSNGLVDGGSMSQTLEENETQSTGNSKEEKTTRIVVTIAGRDPTEEITLYEMSAEDQILRRETLDVNALPEQWTCSADCEWLIVRENEQRSVYTPADESFSAFAAGESGLCVKKSVMLDWKK